MCLSHTGWRVILLTMVTHTANEPADPLLSSPAARCIDGQTGMGRTLDGIRRVLGRPVDVLLQGESGTGKELAARILHEADPVRCAGQFVAVNCAALPEGVLEAELFGVCRGAFTGADVDRRGLFRLADGGTLFLDEVGDLPTSLQPKLLRALQERRIRPLGGVEETSIDVRVISATHVDLNAARSNGYGILPTPRLLSYVHWSALPDHQWHHSVGVVHPDNPPWWQAPDCRAFRA